MLKTVKSSLLGWGSGGSVEKLLEHGGRGIERSYRLSKPYWEKHFKETRSSINEWLDTYPQSGAHESLLILGSGHLLDLDVLSLTENFQTITLYDGDLSAQQQAVKKIQLLSLDDRISFHTSEISGVIQSWIEHLNSTPRNLDWIGALRDTSQIVAASEIPKVGGLPSSQFAGIQASAIISLNILSQIPLLWQEALERWLISRFGTRFVIKNEREWLDAYLVGAQKLVHQHLRDLMLSPSKNILLITDLDYLYYSGISTFNRFIYQQEPVAFFREPNLKDSWIDVREDRSSRLSFESVSALYVADSEEYIRSLAAEHQREIVSVRSWLWHISPLGIANKKKGEIHRVAAFSLTKL